MNAAAWMLFIDGENFTIRAQEYSKKAGLRLDVDPKYYLQDVFVWLPNWPPLTSPFHNRLFPLEHERATRAYYYTSATGDDDHLAKVKRRLRALGFDPQVFKKFSGSAKSKGVDITLTKDMLSHAFLDNYTDAVLIAGDGDYLPLVEEVKRRGKRVYLGFFTGEGLGLSEDLQLAADHFRDLNDIFNQAWRVHAENIKRGDIKPGP